MPQPNTPADEIWTTEDGTKIPVANLSEDHAKNILRMILRSERERREFFKTKLLPELIARIREEHGPDAKIDGIEINGEPFDMGTATGEADIDAAFDKAGAGGHKFH